MTKTHQQNRSLVTFALIAYNQDKYIREAVEGAFSQIYEPIEIILSDDGSSDKTYDIMRDLASRYNGPHKILLNRNSENFGLAKHINKVMEMATGGLIILAAGDDISLPDRVGNSAQEFFNDDTLKMVSLGHTTIDENGKLLARDGTHSDMSLTIKKYFSSRYVHPNGASRAFRPEVFRDFGPLNHNCPTEDTPLLLRALLLGNVKIISKPGIKYRRHANNLSRPDSKYSMNLEHIFKQYRQDIERAYALKLITSQELEKYSRLISNRIDIRRIERDVIFGTTPLFKKFLMLTFSRKMGLRKKVSLLKNLILSALRARVQKFE